MAENEEERKSLLMRVKEESSRAGLRLNIKERSWRPAPLLHGRWKGKRWKRWVTDFLSGSKITVDGDCSLEIRRWLLLGRNVMTNLVSVLQSRGITLPTKVCIVKAIVFPVITYSCESWTVIKAECQRTDAFELWCWKKLLKIPWTTRRSNQSILREINPEYSL